MGGCGLECFVYLEGRCTEPDEMIERLETQEDKEVHERLYGFPQDIESTRPHHPAKR